MRGLENKLLVVVDMQNDFIDGALGSDDAKEIVDRTCKFLQSWNGHVVFTKGTHDEDYLDTAEGRKLPVKHCIKGTHGWNINPDIYQSAYRNSPLIIEKPTFGSRQLQDYVSRMAYDEILVCGVCTGICVVSNVLLMKATVPETKISVIENMCACVTKQSHIEALHTMRMCHINLLHYDDSRLVPSDI